MTVSNGNVGIGTTNPTQKLDVAGYIKGQSGVCISNDCKTSWPVEGFSKCMQVSTGWISNGYATCPEGYHLTGGSCDMWRVGDCRECSPRYCRPEVDKNRMYCNEGNTGQCRAYAVCCK